MLWDPKEVFNNCTASPCSLSHAFTEIYPALLSGISGSLSYCKKRKPVHMWGSKG